MFATVKTAFHCLNAEMKIELHVVHCHVAAAFLIFTQSHGTRNTSRLLSTICDNTQIYINVASTFLKAVDKIMSKPLLYSSTCTGLDI